MVDQDPAGAGRGVSLAQACGVPEITISKSVANMAAIEGIRVNSDADIGLRQSNYVNNIVERDHRTIQRIQRIVRPMMDFKASRRARIVMPASRPCT